MYFQGLSPHRPPSNAHTFLVKSKIEIRNPETLHPVYKGRGRIADIIRISEGMTAMAAPAVTDASFKEDVLDSTVPVLVDFWAPWCGPCRLVGPVVDELAQQYEGKVKVVKLNTDENPDVAGQYGIRSIPTLMIFKGGRHVETVIGAVPKTTLCSTIEKHL
jgi:thioredoxin 1